MPFFVQVSVNQGWMKEMNERLVKKSRKWNKDEASSNCSLKLKVSKE